MWNESKLFITAYLGFTLVRVSDFYMFDTPKEALRVHFSHQSTLHALTASVFLGTLIVQAGILPSAPYLWSAFPPCN